VHPHQQGGISVAQTARDIMEIHVVTVGVNDPLSSVRRLFFDEGIHGAPVVDDQRRVIGIISTTDLLQAAFEKSDSERPHATFTNDGIETLGLDAEETATYSWDEPRVRDHMTDSVVSVQPSASIAEVAATLRQHRIHRLLVVEDGALLGIVSIFDLLGHVEQGKDGARVS